MRRIAWSLHNFRAGLHTEPSKVENGQLYAADMKNLRVGKDGGLEVRYPVRTVTAVSGAISTDTIEGLTQSRRGEDLVILYVDGGLLKAYIIGGTDPTIITDTNVTGKLSSVFLEDNVVVVTSEGSDQGYWLDLQSFDPPSTPTVTGYQFGITPPVAAGITATAINKIGGAMTQGEYFYRITYIRDVTDLTDNDPLKGTSDYPYESNPATDAYPSATVVLGTHNAIQLGNLPVSSDAQVTRKTLWRSSPQFSPVSDPTTLTYTRLTNILNATTSYDDITIATGITGNRSLRIDNDRLPSTTKSLAVYNDRIFAPNRRELRYSDMRDGNSAWWAFPEVNSLLFNSELLFVAKYREMLLFGGPSGVWRLFGTAASNFTIQQLSEIGPVNAHAWSIINDESRGGEYFAFVGIAGVYLCDGARVVSIGSPLQRLFPVDAQVKDAAVVHFPSEETLFSLSLARSSGDVAYGFLRRADGGWEKWEDINVLQGEVVEQTSATTGQKSYDVLLAENGEDEIREVLWDREGFTQDTTQQNTSGVDIPWSYKTQDIDFDSEGLAEINKHFRFLEITVDSSVSMTITVWVNGVQTHSSTVTVGASRPQFPYRFGINRRGLRCQAQFAGTAAPGTIRALRLVATVR